MTQYTRKIKNALIKGLQNRTLKALDFSSYEIPASEPITLTEHTDYVSKVAALPDGKVVSASWDGDLKVCNASTRECLRTLKGHTDCVMTVAALSDGIIVSGSEDKTIKVWEVSTGKCLQTLKGHTEGVISLVALSDRQFISGGRDNTLKLWDVRTGKCLHTFEGHTNAVWCVVVLLDGQVVSASADKTVKLWDVRTGECLRTFKGHTAAVLSVAICLDGRIISASADKTLKLWDVNTDECVRTLTGHDDEVSSVERLLNGDVISTSSDKTLKVWDVRTGACLRTLKGHADQVRSVVVLQDGHVASASWDKTIKLWSLFPRLSYAAIAPVLTAIAPTCGLKTLSCQGVDLGQAGYEHVLRVIQTLPSLESVDVTGTGLTSSQITALEQAVRVKKEAGRLIRLKGVPPEIKKDATPPLLSASHETQIKIKVMENKNPENSLKHLQPTQNNNASPRNTDIILSKKTHIEQRSVKLLSVTVPPNYVCPITQEIMFSPVVAKDGHTYEEEAILLHFETKLTSPLTNERLPTPELIANHAMRSMIREFLEKYPEFFDEGQLETVYFSRKLQEKILSAIQGPNLEDVSSCLQQDPRLLTSRLVSGHFLLEDVLKTQSLTLLTFMLNKFKPAMWTLLLKQQPLETWLDKIMQLPAATAGKRNSAMAVAFLDAAQAALEFIYPAIQLIERGLEECSALFLELGLKRLGGVNLPLDEEKNTALHRAVKQGNIDLVKILLDLGASYNVKNKACQKPRDMALSLDYQDIVNCLTDAKVLPTLHRIGFFEKFDQLQVKVQKQEEIILQQSEKINRLEGINSIQKPKKFRV